jgi:hypothetical protein
MQRFHHLLPAAQFKIKIPKPQEAWPLFLSLCNGSSLLVPHFFYTICSVFSL